LTNGINIEKNAIEPTIEIMNKNLFYLSLILVASILFSSCQTTMIKRHYRKGYYVEHKKHNQESGAAKKESNENSEALTLKSPPALPSIKSELPSAEEQTNEEEPTLGSGTKSKKSVTKNIKERSAYNSDEKEKKAGFLRVKTNKARAVAEKIVGPEGGLLAATLSLFWIIIVVLLVVYLIGIVFEGFGIGGLFHLMALIILILLILWLLGIV